VLNVHAAVQPVPVNQLKRTFLIAGRCVSGLPTRGASPSLARYESTGDIWALRDEPLWETDHMNSWLTEFREFALKGNVVDLAVGVIIGAAFGKIVAALVDNVLMPPIGFLLGGVDFKDLAINMGTAQSPVLIKYGMFIQTMIDFAIIAFVLFVVIKGMNTLKKRFEKEAVAAPPKPSASEMYLKEIRDALVKK
jgi:large conductance mechanosensitive channel